MYEAQNQIDLAIYTGTFEEVTPLRRAFSEVFPSSEVEIKLLNNIGKRQTVCPS